MAPRKWPAVAWWRGTGAVPRTHNYRKDHNSHNYRHSHNSHVEWTLVDLSLCLTNGTAGPFAGRLGTETHRFLLFLASIPIVSGKTRTRFLRLRVIMTSSPSPPTAYIPISDVVPGLCLSSVSHRRVGDYGVWRVLIMEIIESRVWRVWRL